MRNPFARGDRPPADVLTRAGVGGGDRVLAAAEARDGTWVVGTATSLVIVPAVAERPATTIPWQRVQHADWDSEEERLRVTEVGEYGQVRPVHLLPLTDPQKLLRLVRERVTASVVLQRRVTVEGKRGFFVLARRAPTGSGDVEWAYEFDPDVDPQDPEVRRLADSALRAAAEEVGL